MSIALISAALMTTALMITAFCFRRAPLLVSALALSTLPGLALAQCTDDVTTAATTARQCEVNQSRADECNSPQQQLNDLVNACLKQPGLQRAQVDFARQQGYVEVKGDPAKSPWKLAHAEQRIRERWLVANHVRLQRMLGDNSSNSMSDNFNTEKCPGSFEPRGDRSIFISSFLASGRDRYGLPLAEGLKETLHVFFATPIGETCQGSDLASPDASRREAPIYGLDTTLQQRITTRLGEQQRARPLIHSCGNPADCHDELQRLYNNYERYTAVLSDKTKLDICMNYADSYKRGEIDIAKLEGSHCDPATAASKLENNRIEASKLRALLFGGEG